jgi:hypothetical protein
MANNTDDKHVPPPPKKKQTNKTKTKTGSEPMCGQRVGSSCLKDTRRVTQFVMSGKCLVTQFVMSGKSLVTQFVMSGKSLVTQFVMSGKSLVGDSGKKKIYVKENFRYRYFVIVNQYREMKRDSIEEAKSIPITHKYMTVHLD